MNARRPSRTMVTLAHTMIFLAVASTVCLAYCLLPSRVPGDSMNRSVYLLLCAIGMVPRWLCLTGALLVCVRLGHAPWSGERGPQYAAVVAAQLVLGVCCSLCLMISYEGRRPFDAPSAAFRLVPFVVPVLVTLFAAWMLLADPRPADGRGASPVARVGWVALGMTAALFVMTALASYLYDDVRRAREAAASDAAEGAAEVARLAADEARFRALTPADPLPAWLAFIAHDTPAATKAAAVAAIARRPTLADDVRAEFATGDYLIEGRALSLFGRLPPDVSVGLIDVFRHYGRTLVAEEQAAAADPVFEKARDRFAFASARANAFADAGRALFAAGVDVRPELDAVAEAARGHDFDGARDIVRLYDCDRAEFAKREAGRTTP